MVRLTFIALLTFALVAAVVPVTAPRDNFVREAMVERVIDGDSLVMNISLGAGVGLVNRHVRLHGVHAFETGTELGDKETAYLRELIASTTAGECSIEIKGLDKYGRLLGVVWLGNVNLNEKMLAQPQGGR